MPKKADRYEFGTIYTLPDAENRFSANASENKWIFVVYRGRLSEAKLLANELENEFKTDITIVVLDREPNISVMSVPADY